MIFEFFRATGVLIWHMDVLRTSTRIVDIDLIRDEANEAAPNRGPRLEVQPLGVADTVEQAQGMIMLLQSLPTLPRLCLPRELVGHRVPPGLHHQYHWSQLLGSRS